VDKKLKEAKAGDMVTVQKLKSLDEKNVSCFLLWLVHVSANRVSKLARVSQSGFVAFGHFLTGFFLWMDPELGANTPSDASRVHEHQLINCLLSHADDI
jgi:hypothetical protein